MTKKNLIIMSVIILACIGLFAGGYYIFKNYFQKQGTIANLNTGLPGQLFGPKAGQKAANLDPLKVLNWTNQYRGENNLPALKTNSILVTASQKKVTDMFQKQYFEHVSPSGVTPSDLVSITGYNYKITGENLALGDFQNEKDLVDAWMASPGHRANILNRDYTEIGIATGLDTFEDRGKTWLAVQEFGKPLPNCQKPSSTALDDINSKKSEYENLVSQINSLYAGVSHLNNQANQKIKQGNDLYTQTNDKTQAQTYWDEGTSLRAQADADTNKAKNLQTQADSLLSEIQKESTTYNTGVDAYNSCIKQ